MAFLGGFMASRLGVATWVNKLAMQVFVSRICNPSSFYSS